MSFIEPVFDGSYGGELVYEATSLLVDDDFIKYIESIEIVHDSTIDKQITGFSDVIYHLNSVTTEQKPGKLLVTLVGDLPKHRKQQLQQLAKACLGGGLSLFISDDIILGSVYYCKWENAGDFVENSELLCGGTIALQFYHRGAYTYVLLQATTAGTEQTGHFNISGTGIAGVLQSKVYKITPSAAAPATDASRPQIYSLDTAPNELLVKQTNGTVYRIALSEIATEMSGF